MQKINSERKQSILLIITLILLLKIKIIVQLKFINRNKQCKFQGLPSYHLSNPDEEIKAISDANNLQSIPANDDDGP